MTIQALTAENTVGKVNMKEVYIALIPYSCELISILPIPKEIKLSTGPMIDSLDVTLRKRPKLAAGVTMYLTFDFKLLNPPLIEVNP